MLSYQHVFHAGNHADILKHFVLTYVLQSLNKKDKPYTFFDTHSGSAIYNLFDARSLKTNEAEKGIVQLLKSDDCPVQMRVYLDFVAKYYNKQLYPGSPEIERYFMRSQDTLVLSELHPQEIKNLEYNIKNPVFPNENFPSVQVHKRNGWEMIKALTPPKTKRGAVLIDPSYEETQDYDDAARIICEINKKWSNGIILLWYPLLAHREEKIEYMIDTICDSVRKLNENTEINNIQLKVYDKNAENLPRLYGSGMLVINAPWQLKEQSDAVIDYVQKKLAKMYENEKEDKKN